jgi:hypothetical protein
MESFISPHRLSPSLRAQRSNPPRDRTRQSHGSFGPSISASGETFGGLLRCARNDGAKIETRQRNEHAIPPQSIHLFRSLA